MQTGKIDNQGYLKGGLLQKVYETDIASADSYTKLLIHGNAIADATGKTVTANGNAAVTTAQYKFASVGASIIFDGTGDYLSLADSADWDIGTDFTIDFWMRPASLAVDYQIPFAQRASATSRYLMWMRTSGELTWRIASGADLSINTSGAGISAGNWYHIACVKNSSSWKVYVNGIQKASATDATSVTGIAASFLVGYDNGAEDNAAFNGCIAEFRVSNGVARWTSEFTPPTTPYDGATKSLTISGLDGNTDIVYLLKMRNIAGSSSTTYYGLRPNNDSGSNYGYQCVQGQSTGVYASRSTSETYIWIFLYGSLAAGDVHDGSMWIYAKSGYLRTFLSKEGGNIVTTTVNSTFLSGQVWNNTSDNIISLVIVANQNNGLGVGTHIELWALKKHS